MLCQKNDELLNKLVKTNLLPLAFIGDAVHTLFIREYTLENYSVNKMDNYHSLSSKYCKASSQAKTLNYILPLLDEEEKEIVRRGRNAKPKHQAKNASNADYAYATAFEILIGFLYLKGDENRLNKILNLSISSQSN